MEYSLKATINTPALTIFLLDISSSMALPMTNGTRIEIVNQALKSIISQMVAASTWGKLVSPRFHVAIYAYSDEVYDLLGGIQPIDQIAKHEIPTLKPQGTTQTAQAFSKAEELLLEVLPSYVDCPAPVVCHLTDGEFNGEDPEPIIERIKRLYVRDGNVLVTNIFVTNDILSESTPLPNSWIGISAQTELPSLYVRKLRDWASPLPEPYRATMRELGVPLEPNTVMMVPGNSKQLLLMAFQFGTITRTRLVGSTPNEEHDKPSKDKPGSLPTLGPGEPNFNEKYEPDPFSHTTPDWVLVIAYPKNLAKGNTSYFNVSIPKKALYELARLNSVQRLRQLGEKEAVQTKNFDLSVTEEVVVIRLESPHVLFTPPEGVTTRIPYDDPGRAGNSYFTTDFVAVPKNEASPQKPAPIRVTLTEKASAVEIVSSILNVSIDDYLIGSISRPFAARVGTTMSMILSGILWVLAFLEQIDKTAGFTAGTASLAIAGFIGFSSYLRYKSTSGTTTIP